MSDWRIHRREARCTQCERVFQEGETFFSLIFFEGDRLRREDRCPACFEEPRAVGDLFFWRTRHQADRRARFAVDFEAIEELFLSLEGRREERLRELRYLLSLLLLRKKRLKLVGVRRNEGSETLCLRRPRRTEEFEVQVFELDSERAQALKAELARVFDGAGVEALAAAPVHLASDAGGTPVAEARAGESTG
ncbi:MAG: hypothetical protein HOP15_11395 [Planctomycetes bacterium]|nr:hypothetical protein [Planctomycetota bacterium]